MRKTLLVFIALIAISAVFVGCPGPNDETGPTVEQVTVKLTVAYIPPGWYLAEDRAPAADGTKDGFIVFKSGDETDFVSIHYGAIPLELRGRETDGDALISLAVKRSTTFDPTTTGTMVVAGRMAGYAQASDNFDVLVRWHHTIVFIRDQTHIDVYSSWVHRFDETASEIRALINSIR